MRKIVLFILIGMLVLPGCSNQNVKENYPIYEGTVVFKTDKNDKYKFLVLQNISKEDLENGNLQDFIELAQDQEASYYLVDKENYGAIEVGQRVKITAHFNQLESLPPIRTVVSIQTINE
ncbi:DUF3221 domain-containing protein [Paenibacillus illinoisensis]|uniref:DUF3221 domain-containing protein n=1 Tax=Paenibacillus illinoisensis TaxID=59845 RepID=A0A2W0CE62_9BACL|nr:DUF3221 domain-containing protein [Paenibacillus illinoisensis]PYY31026.1 Uncharacterized protein PIL02S_00573 [Paenibacillus illinoisensis]